MFRLSASYRPTGTRLPLIMASAASPVTLVLFQEWATGGSWTAPAPSLLQGNDFLVCLAKEMKHNLCHEMIPYGGRERKTYCLVGWHMSRMPHSGSFHASFIHSFIQALVCGLLIISSALLCIWKLAAMCLLVCLCCLFVCSSVKSPFSFNRKSSVNFTGNSKWTERLC